MKASLYCLTLLLMIVFIMPSNTEAQSNVLKIYATPLAIDSVISMDQQSGSPHSVYQLVSTDTTYIFDKTSVFDYDVTIQGVLALDGRPPCIQPDVLKDGSVAAQPFTFSKDGGTVKLENLYLEGVSIDNSVNTGSGVAAHFTGKNMKVYINNVIFEQWGQFAISDGSQDGSFWITNCKFRNMVNSGSVYTGEAFRMRNDLGTNLADTIIVKYNTFLAVNAYALCAPITGYLAYGEFSHNTVVGMLKNVIRGESMENMVIAHNIFYAAYCGGQANGEFPAWDNASSVLSSVIDAYYKVTKASAVMMGIDTTQADWSAKAEAARRIDVNDNIYFRPQALDDFYTSWNANYADTTTSYIHITGWMNDETQAMFNDKTSYPNLSTEGNQIGTDPGYGQGITDMMGGTGVTVPSEDGVGLIAYLTAARTNAGAAGTYYSYHQSVPDFSSGNWVPTWPLPEYTSGDLKYSASLTATDGKKYGDPYWFTGEITGVQAQPNSLPSKFDLSNNYPNPFNPSTTINFSLAKEGNVSLKVYNIMGELVKTIVDNAYKSAGSYNVSVRMDNFSSGIYFYTLTQGPNMITKKMILLK